MDDVAAQLDRLRAELEAFDREFQRLAAEQRETGGERDAS
jgi:prefoldin subunit 5